MIDHFRLFRRRLLLEPEHLKQTGLRGSLPGAELLSLVVHILST